MTHQGGEGTGGGYVRPGWHEDLAWTVPLLPTATLMQRPCSNSPMQACALNQLLPAYEAQRHQSMNRRSEALACWAR